MRIGAVWESCPNAHYRAIDPLKAMARRGHHIKFPRTEEGAADLNWLSDCDLVHVYRRGSPQTRSVLAELARRGTAITYDNDDDLSAVPKGSPTYKKLGGVTGHRIFGETVKAARLAQVCTTTSEALAEKYRDAGIARVEVIGNYLAPDVRRPARGHDGIVVGWIAAVEHRVDAQRLGLAAALERLVAEHDDVRVECIGVDLGLAERYTHDAWVPLPDLPRRIGGFDVGIAPLADLPWNQSRSDIKVKEYAASGVPWLASPIGPYLGLGEAEGGQLVPDDGWFEALDRLVTNARARRRLAKKAKKWAKGQTVDAVAERWERVFAEAAAGAAARAPAA
jgi:glycosyltransferase involved in cell wall biosynthesis